MTSTQTTEDRIKEFVLKQFPAARKAGLKPEDKWLESGLVDSLGILDLVHFLEEEFSFSVSDDELLPENFESLKSVADFAEARKKRAQ
jgi:acyl carrier protein